MRLQSFVGILLVLFLFAPTMSSAADPPDGFRYLKWGASPTTGLKKFFGPTSDGTTLYIQAPGKAPAPMFKAPVAEELFSFSHSKFYRGNAWFDGSGNFEKVKAALFSTYGRPSFVNEKLYLWKWKWPGNKVEVQLNYQLSSSRTTVTFLNDAV